MTNMRASAARRRNKPLKPHNRSRLAALALAAALVGSLFLSSCGKEKSQSPQQVPQEQTAAVNVNYGISNPWDSLMPYYSVSGSNYARIIYDKLYDRLAYVQADGTCQPRAAERWESADDGYSIVFFLNQKAAFHDGTPVTAQHPGDQSRLPDPGPHHLCRPGRHRRDRGRCGRGKAGGGGGG